ncbi:MAG: ABC transporter permease [Acidobacteria bacterium]|jgi:lipoprotein-releasing system permease protein|nr:ABC transporter permease [Acidobacteriota bacterium]
MSFELKLAWTYFRARRKSLARFTSFVAVTGVAAGVASLILAQALARGFADEMQNKILANTPHVSVFMNEEAKINDWRQIKKDLEKLENITEIFATTFENALIAGTQATNYAVLRVVQNSNTEVQKLKFKVQSSNLQVQSPESKVQSENAEGSKQMAEEGRQLIIEIALGAELAEKTDLKSGDEAEIITLANQVEPKRVRVIVKEIFRTGLFEYDSTWVNISPENFAALHGNQSFSPSILSVSVRNIFEADKIAEEIRAKLGANFRVLDWQEANQPLFAALSLERQVGLVIFALIIFIAALNITTTLALLVNERKFDIAILRTCGAKTQSLIIIFLLEGLFLGCAGIFFGVVFGLLGCFFGNYFKIISLSAEVYSLNYIPFHLNIYNVLLIVSMTLVLCLTAAVYPAFRASRIKPLENLRN